jgi:hypothetical protein
MSATSRDTNSERRIAVAKPRSRSARSRIVDRRLSAIGAIAMIRSAVAGAFFTR